MDGKHDQEFDILVKFNYDDGEYVIVTDNTTAIYGEFGRGSR